MVHRTSRSAVIALLLLLLVAGLGPGATAQGADAGGDLVLAIEDVETYARAHSPRLRILAAGAAATAAERDEQRAWSDPALAYDHEEADGSREWQVTLHKRLERPLRQGHLRGAWDERVRAADLEAEQATRDLLADLKAGYVELRLLESRLERLERLEEVVAAAAGIAGHRQAAGAASGLDGRLVQLAAYTVEAAGRHVRSEHGRRLAGWRADMGIPPAQELRLVTEVGYRKVDETAAAAARGLLAGAPGDEAQVALVASLGGLAAAARPGLLPGLDLYGGYKSFAGDEEGFVAGVAVDLPLFGKGKGEAARLQAERQSVAAGLAADRLRRDGEFTALVGAVQAAEPALADFAARTGPVALADVLLVSYREGAISLDDVLGAVQVETAALAAHHDELAAYYGNLFRLEALTGSRFVHFGPGE